MQEKKKLLNILISIGIIIALALFIVNINNLFPKKVIAPVEKNTSTDYSNCFKESPGTVIFVYSNSCPHCTKMKPIVQELEQEGYEFYWADGADPEARQVISACFQDLLSGYVPEFICPARGTERTGEMTKTELKSFADSCTSS